MCKDNCGSNCWGSENDHCSCIRIGGNCIASRLSVSLLVFLIYSSTSTLWQSYRSIIIIIVEAKH